MSHAVQRQACNKLLEHALEVTQLLDHAVHEVTALGFTQHGEQKHTDHAMRPDRVGCKAQLV